MRVRVDDRVQREANKQTNKQTYASVLSVSYHVLASHLRLKRLFPPGIEPGTFRVLGGCDNHYTTETAGRVLDGVASGGRRSDKLIHI